MDCKYISCNKILIEFDTDYRCPGYPFNECNNAGDCVNGMCVCDNGFSGDNCESMNHYFS